MPHHSKHSCLGTCGSREDGPPRLTLHRRLVAVDGLLGIAVARLLDIAVADASLLLSLTSSAAIEVRQDAQGAFHAFIRPRLVACGAPTNAPQFSAVANLVHTRSGLFSSDPARAGRCCGQRAHFGVPSKSFGGESCNAALPKLGSHDNPMKNPTRTTRIRLSENHTRTGLGVRELGAERDCRWLGLGSLGSGKVGQQRTAAGLYGSASVRERLLHHLYAVA